MYKIEERVAWLQERVAIAKADGLAIAISGGIDSAVVAALAKKAFPNNTIGMFLDIDNSEVSKSNFVSTADALGIEKITLNLSKPFDLLMAETFKGEDSVNKDLIGANIKARLRMTEIYAQAQKNNYLVLETTNLSEAILGYYTKWGDGAGDIAPISDLYKREVYELAKELGIPQQVIDTLPTADLWEGQTDEGEMGFTYDDFEKWHKGEDVPEDISNKIETMVKNNQHKMDGIYQFIEYE